MTRWMWGAIAIVAAMFVGASLASTAYVHLFPERMPIHWNIQGQPDGWVARDDKFIGFFLFPTITVGVIVLGLVLPWLSPVQFKVESFRRIYDFVFFLLASLIAWTFVFSLRSSATGELDFRWLLGGIFLFFALMGNVLGKVRKNFWMGVRTPWTLASDVVWEKTHRLAAWLFVVAGAVGFVASLAGVSPVWCFTGVMVAALYPVVYSLVIYKQLERSGQLQMERQPVVNES